MKKHKYVAVFILLITLGLVVYFIGVFELNYIKNYGDLGIDKMGFYTNAKDLLPRKLKKLYDKIDNNIYSLNPDVDFANMSSKDVRKVIEYYKADNPQVFWLKSDFSLEQQLFTDDIVGVNLEYFYVDNEKGSNVAFTQDLVKQMNKQLELESKKIIDSIPKYFSDYEKAKYLHDYIVSTVDYDENANFSHNSYGALVDKKAVCDGMSKAYMYLLSQIDIESRIVYGKSKYGVSHAWNIIKLGDEYYHVDLTWDMPQGDSDTIIYSNFGLTDEETKKNKYIYSPFTDNLDDSIYAPIPKCDSIEYNYYKKQGLLIYSYNDKDIEYILDLVNKAVEHKEKSIQIKFINKENFDKFILDLTQGTNDKFYRFPYKTSEREVSIKTQKTENIVIFEFKYK